MKNEDWIGSREMAECLGIHRATLQKLRREGFLKEKQHWIKKNPLSARGDFMWHEVRTMMRMNRI